MRILLVSNLYPSSDRPYGGTFITQRVKALEARGHQVWTYGVRPVGVGAVALASRVRGRSAHDPPPAPPFADYRLRVDLKRRRRPLSDTTNLASTRQLVDLVRREEVDLVHGHGMYLFPAGAVARDVARTTGLPSLVSVHGSDVHTFMPRRMSAYGPVFDAAGAVICVSDALATQVREAMSSRDAVYVVPNGYDPKVFFVDERASDESTNDAHTGERGGRLLFVGNLELIKGADRLPGIMQHLRELRPDARLHVVGAGTLGAQLRQGLPDAVFHGQVAPAEVARLMRQSDVLVVPSRHEGWGTVITEAYACGLPSVAFAVGGIPEAIQLHEHLVPTHAGVAALARSVADVLAQPHGRAHLASLVADRTWADVASAEEKVYRRARG